jgi:hypothetical protein
MAAAPVVRNMWDFEFAGAPDLSDPVQILALGPIPRVLTANGRHPLAVATPWANWVILPGANAEAAPVGSWVSHAWWDLWCLEGAIASDGILASPDVLRLCVTPAWGNDYFTALVLVGGLDLNVVYPDPATFLSALRVASLEARVDPRLVLGLQGCFLALEPAVITPPRLAYAYAFTGDSLIDGSDCSALGRLGFALRPRVQSLGRDSPGDPFLRLMEALRCLSAVRSAYFRAQVETPTGFNFLEIAEPIGDTWMALHSFSPIVCAAERPIKRALEIELLARLTFGSDEQKNTAFTEQFTAILAQSERIAFAVDEQYGPMSEILGRYEQLAGFIVPGARWNSRACASGVEVMLRDWMPSLASLEQFRGAERMAAFSQLVAHSKAAVSVVGAPSESLTVKAALGASGVEAMRAQEFVTASERLKVILAAEEPNLLDVFDTLLDSNSKMLHCLATRHLKKTTGCTVIQDCSPYLSEFGAYWAMCLGTVNGVVLDEIQGHSVPEKEVDLLLRGEWASVDWIAVSSMLDLWLHGVSYDGPVLWHEFEALTRIELVLRSTFKMLRLDSSACPDASAAASLGDQEGVDVTSSGGVSFAGLFARILALQRKSGIMPKGSVPRKNHESNVSGLLILLLKSGGKRWNRQFQGEINFASSLQKEFLTDSSEFLNSLQKHETVALQLFKFKETLPGLLHAWSEPSHNELVDSNLKKAAREDSREDSDSPNGVTFL